METLGEKKSARGALCVLALTLGLASEGLAFEDVWTPQADMPTARHILGACAMDGKIYAIGGCLTHSSQDVGTSAVEVYDPANDTWERKASMPKVEEVGLTAAAVDEKIYAIGGIRDPRGTYAYDPATNIWTRKADMPEATYFHAAAVVDGKIYVVGGGPQEYVESATVYAYDPAADTWARRADTATGL